MRASASPPGVVRQVDGEVHCPGYLDDADSRALLVSLPLEHLAHNATRMPKARLMPRLVNRLRRERLRYQDFAGGTATLLTRADAEADDLGLRAWALQSYARTSVHRPGKGIDGIRQTAGRTGHLFFSRPGDALHPSAAGIVMQTPDAPDVVFWNRFAADEMRAGSPGTVLTRPCFDPATFRHGAVTDTTLAVKGSVMAKAPDAVLAAILDGRFHPLLFWLAGVDLRWHLHPEALTVGCAVPPLRRREEIALDECFYEALLAQEGNRFALQPTPGELSFPYAMVPARRARKVSVLISFRDRADQTLTCLESIGRQTLSGELEVVLVDNQSGADELGRVKDGAHAIFGGDSVKHLRYDRPFNHSAQNNLAVEAAGGEVVVLCNNDITIEEPVALEQLAAWALQPDVATVGCRLENIGRKSGSYGHAFAPHSPDPFRSPLKENDDPFYGGFIHASPGNTLALAAIEKSKFLALGGLDAERFPIGYNDVEFMLRCTRAGLIHLYLGHVWARHQRGSSRTGDNEDLQALLVNQLYSAETGFRSNQLHRERVGSAAAGPNPQPAPEGALQTGAT